MKNWCTQKWKNDKSKRFRKTKKHKIAGSRYNEQEHICISFGMCLAAILVFASISVASATNYMPQDCYSFTIESSLYSPVSDPAGPYTGTEGVPLIFTGSGSYDPDGSIVAYEWDFGDENIATGVAPTHTYAQDGTYTITLKVTGNDGATNTSTTTATIADIEPTTDFSASPSSGQEPLTVEFTDNSASYDGIVMWAWDFDNDDMTDSTEQNPTQLYAEEGVYTVSLNVTESDGDSDSMTKTDYITVTKVNNAPYVPDNPSPSDGATDVPVDMVLSWTGGDPDAEDTVTYDVYFGTSMSPPLVAENQPENTYDPGTRDYSTEYYWRIAATDNHGDSNESEAWNFTTASSPAPDLVAEWHLDEGDGLTAGDTSGNGNDGTLVNNPAWVAGKVGKGLSFDGTNDYVVCGQSSSLKITGAITVEAWVKWQGAGNPYFVTKTGGPGHRSYDLSGNEDGTVEFRVGGADCNSVKSSGTISIPTGEWVYLVGTYEPSSYVRLFVDGSLVRENTVSIPASQGDNGLAWYIGAREGNQGWFNGIIDEAKIYNGALSAEEIRANYNAYPSNLPPTAFIDSIMPSAAEQGKDTVSFTGHGTDTDGSVVAYNWRSDLDGQLSSASSFGKPASELSEGTHTIYFKVQDDDGAWSTEVMDELTIIEQENLSPIADPKGPYTGTEGVAITFDGSGSYDPDGTIDTYEWVFGDGSNATGVTPSHTYAHNGTYTVILTVTDNDGAANTSTTTATIADTEPTAEFSASPISGPEPLTVTFTDNSASYDGIIAWDWDFDSDGEIDSTEQNPTYEYAEDGVYTVNLKVTESDGNCDTMTKMDYIIVTAVNQIEYIWLEAEDADTTTPDFETVSDISASNGEYIQIPKGVGFRAHDGEATYRITIDSPSDYIVWGSKIAATGGDNSFSVQIDDGTKYLWAISLSDNWQWDAVNHWGSGEEFNPEIDPLVFTLSAGEHTVRIIQREDGAKLDELLITNDMSYVPVSNQPPTAVIDSITPEASEQGKETLSFTGHGTDTDGSVVAYNWRSNLDGQLSTASSFGKPATELSVGTHVIYFKVQDDKGAWSTEVRKDLTIIEPANQAPVVDLSGPYTGTEGISIDCDGSGSYDPEGSIVAYEWDFGDGETITEVNPTHTYAQDGTYTVALTVTDNKGATNMSTTTATIADTEPAADFSAAPTSGPEPVTVAFTDNSASYDGIETWNWDFDNDGETDSTEQNPTHEYLEYGRYTVSLTVTESDGDCDAITKSDYILVIRVNEPPEADPSGPYTGTEGLAIAYDGSGSYDTDGSLVAYEWDFGDETTATGVAPTHTYAQSGTYTVALTVTDNDGATNTSTTTATIADTEPTAAFSAKRTHGPEPLTVAFTDNSASYDGIEEWAWDFDNDGETDSTEQNPTHVYREYGRYTVSLTVTESDGDSGTMTKADYITAIIGKESHRHTPAGVSPSGGATDVPVDED
jgi:PKD repeat protein